MPIVEHFKHDKYAHPSYLVLVLDAVACAKVSVPLPSLLRQCYISDERLNGLMAKGKSRDVVLKSVLPDEGNIMAGDFGEILTYYLLKGRYRTLPLKGFRKWRLKHDRNKAAPYTDVVLYLRTKADPKRDIIVAAESKVKATQNKRYDPIQAALNGTQKDFVSRLAATLSWLKDRAVLAADEDSEQDLNRFINSIEPRFGPYTKHFKAVAIIDGSMVSRELAIAHKLPTKIPNLEVVVVSVEQLQAFYESVYAKVVNG